MKFLQVPDFGNAYVLTISQTSDFRLFQNEIVCRRQFQIRRKWPKVFQKGRKHWEKEELLITSNFSFSHSVFKRLLLSPLQKHVRKVVGGFGKKSCVSTGVRKPGTHMRHRPP